MSEEIDIGHDHFIRFYAWAPDDLPENRARFGFPLPNVPKAGLLIRHRGKDGQEHDSGVAFDLPEMRTFGQARWQVISWDPLTLAPSILCGRCGDHGFIREGRWVPA